MYADTCASAAKMTQSVEVQRRSVDISVCLTFDVRGWPQASSLDGVVRPAGEQRTALLSEDGQLATTRTVRWLQGELARRFYELAAL